jgi:hypothetical protein
MISRVYKDKYLLITQDENDDFLIKLMRLYGIKIKEHGGYRFKIYEVICNG